MPEKEAIAGFSLKCVGAYPEQAPLNPLVETSITQFKNGVREVGCPFLGRETGNCNVPSINSNSSVEPVKCVQLFPVNSTLVSTESPIRRNRRNTFYRSDRLSTVLINGSLVRTLRKQHEQTQEALAPVLGTSRGYISSIEKPNARISKVIAQRIAEAYGIALEDLLVRQA